jgi:hypothetical protein
MLAVIKAQAGDTVDEHLALLVAHCEDIERCTHIESNIPNMVI